MMVITYLEYERRLYELYKQYLNISTVPNALNDAKEALHFYLHTSETYVACETVEERKHIPIMLLEKINESRLEKMNQVLKEEQERDAECHKAEKRARLYEEMCKYFLDEYENNAPYRYKDNEPYVNNRKNWYRKIKNRIRALEDV